MTVKDVVDRYFGTQIAMAEYLGVSTTAVNQWVFSDSMPLMRAIAIENYTGGRVKAVSLVNKKSKQLLRMIK